MIALLLALSFAQAEPTSTRCHFTGACATAGHCDDYLGKMCVTRSAASCAASYTCIVNGECNWLEGKNACRGADPADCAPESAACRLYGNCKARKPGEFFCGPTKDGCKSSAACKSDGLCAIGRSEVGRQICLPTAAGCEAAFNCALRGDCAVQGQDCGHDPSGCAASTNCREYGTCTSNGGICAHLSSADCASGRVCTVYGKCTLRIQSCDANDFTCAPYSCVPRPDCAHAEICKRYGACRATNNRCVVQLESPGCTTKTVKVASILASTTHPDWSGLSFSGSHLVDGRYDTAWAPSPDNALPHRLKLTLAQKERVAGIRIALGMHRIDRKEGILAYAFGQPRGVVVHVGGKVHEVFETRRQLDWQTLSFAPITTDVIELEVFDASPGERFPSYAVSELEVLVCE